MYLSRVTFGVPSSPIDFSEFDDPVTGYLVNLRKNGQICGDFLHAFCSGTVVAYVKLTRPDAISHCYHSRYGLKDLARLVNIFGTEPTWQILEDNVPTSFPDIHASSSLFLFTTAFDEGSPVCCGDTGERLPAYLIPIDDDEREHLFFWSREYNHLDNIWLRSGELEIPAYQQLASPASGLAQDGRRLAEKVEAALGIPTYYFLMRYYGREEGETQRTCPGCNGQWLIEENLHSKPFWKFPFRCEKCRLVSRLADTVDEDDFAYIGEFESQAEADDSISDKR
ncbi:MAG TPA: DUF2310 family Zn-ribbon-containing protein [Acidobacteriota bacterium]|nr:DUF2310 family Zn-ribbon-containing protein [Acidobacteriota bacterium]